MGPFDDDSFDDFDPLNSIVREFFGGTPRRYREEFIRNEEEERVIDFIEGKDRIYLIFELAGFNEDDVFVSVSGKTITIEATKKNLEEIKEYLSQKLRKGIKYRQTLPESANPKKFKYTLKNGILEVVFDRK